jgi:molecular chaperone DnaK
MVKDAEKYAGDDAKRREDVELRNQADTLVYTTEKSVKELGDKLGESDRKNIEEKLAAAKEALKGKDADKIRQSLEELTKASHKLAEEVYKKTGQQKSGAGSSSGSARQEGRETEGPQEPKKKDDVIDAEYKVEDDDKDK